MAPGQARDDVNNGEALPYSTIKDRLMEKYRGEVLRAELFKLENGKLQYEFSWKTGDGRFLELKVDAMTGNVVESSGG